MECEICGKEFKGNGYRILIEGSEVNVCFSCKSFGSEKKISKGLQKGAKRILIKKKQSTPSIEFTEELLENYNKIIKREREKRGWSQEVLAKKIQEKESLIRKIENAEINPEPSVIEKIEKLFNIKLRERVPEVAIDFKKTDLIPTLGDVVVIKKKKSN
ncbi:MAG TPA: TIGR00270 family protein [Archaeoglobaceae archaeon]|nr:TIGR00270 family protein [Archaeoglobaceae archaeon]